jgi:hypothetical protein
MAVVSSDFKTALPVMQYNSMNRRLTEIQQTRKLLQSPQKETAFQWEPSNNATNKQKSCTNLITERYWVFIPFMKTGCP